MVKIEPSLKSIGPGINFAVDAKCRNLSGFGAVSSAARFCRCHDELRNLLHTNSHLRQTSLPTTRRRRFLQGTRIALTVMASS
jgi:hypothetical protein